MEERNDPNFRAVDLAFMIQRIAKERLGAQPIATFPSSSKATRPAVSNWRQLRADASKFAKYEYAAASGSLTRHLPDVLWFDPVPK
jgi:hypothetical protein